MVQGIYFAIDLNLAVNKIKRDSVFNIHNNLRNWKESLSYQSGNSLFLLLLPITVFLIEQNFAVDVNKAWYTFDFYLVL